MAAPPAASLDDAAFWNAFLDITEAWHLRDRESCKLIGVTEATFCNWKARRPRLSADQRDLISHLANIDLAFEAIFNGHVTAKEFVRCKNRAFDERTPLDVMMNDGLVGIIRIRNYLERLR